MSTSVKIQRVTAVVLTGGLLAMGGCSTDTQNADAAIARAVSDRLVSGAGSASHLYAPGRRHIVLAQEMQQPVDDPPVVDERVSAAQAATASDLEVEMNTISMTIPSEELLLLEARAPIQARPGEPFEYEVEVTNISNRPLANIEIKEYHSENLEFLATESEIDAVEVDPQGWRIDHLAPGETKTILINARALEAGEADLCLTATMMPLVCLVTDVVQPQVEVTKTGPPETLRCEPIEYTITVRNTGIGPVHGVMIVDELPPGLTHEGAQTIEIDAGTLETGESKEFPVVVEATSIGKFTNTARITSDDGLEKEASYTVVVREPRLEITNNGPTRDYLGTPLTYEITVTNVGDAAAKDAVLTESMPRGAEFESATLDGRDTGDRVTWSLGTINPGESKTVSVRMRVNDEGKFTNTAVATAYCAEEVRAEVTTALTGISALLIEVVDTQDPVRIGDETSYEITVTNQGSKKASDVQIRAMLDPGVEFSAASGETLHRVDGGTIIFQPLLALEAGESATWTITVRGAAVADTRFRVEMTSMELEEPVNEEESTHVYEGE